MKKALWIATKFFVFGLCIWVWYEIEAIEAGMIHGGRAQVAVVAITVIGVIVLSPVEPTAEWMGKKKMMINIGGIGAAAGLEAPAVRAQPQQAGAMKRTAVVLVQ